MAEKKVAKLLSVRKKKNAKKPYFRRQENHRYSKLGLAWRKPRGRHSKLRKGLKERGNVPSVGYSSPRAVRGLSHSGLNPINVSNASDIKGLNPKKDVAVIRSQVGKKKRLQIAAEAEKLGVVVSNAYRVRMPRKAK